MLVFLGLSFPQTHAAAQPVGRVRGAVSIGGTQVLSDATIRVMPQQARRTRYRSRTGRDGNFVIDGIEPGLYTVAVVAPGSEERLLENVTVPAEGEANLGEIDLRLATCPSPGIICESLGPEETVQTFSTGNLKIPLGCSVDVDKGAALCTDPPPASQPESPAADFSFQITPGQQVLVELRKGTRLAAPNTPGAYCRSREFLDRPIRIDGYGPGSSFCIRTSDSHYSRIYLTTEIAPDSPRIAFAFVTWK